MQTLGNSGLGLTGNSGLEKYVGPSFLSAWPTVSPDKIVYFFFIITNLHFYKSVNENRNVSRTKQVQWLKYKGDEESSAREIALYREIEGFEKQKPGTQEEYFKKGKVTTAFNTAKMMEKYLSMKVIGGLRERSFGGIME